MLRKRAGDIGASLQQQSSYLGCRCKNGLMFVDMTRRAVVCSRAHLTLLVAKVVIEMADQSIERGLHCVVGTAQQCIDLFDALHVNLIHRGMAQGHVSVPCNRGG